MANRTAFRKSTQFSAGHAGLSMSSPETSDLARRLTAQRGVGVRINRSPAVPRIVTEGERVQRLRFVSELSRTRSAA